MKTILSLILSSALAAPASAQTQLQKLLPHDPIDWAGFGNAVALDGDVAVVGASTRSQGGLNYAGAVYVFRRAADGTWSEEAALVRPIPEIHDNFGSSVAVEGDLLVAGAPDFPFSSFTGVGAAFVYRRSGGVWLQEAELHGSTAHVDSGFGRAVALDGNRILVGANLNSGGCCYVFEHNGGSWTETARMQAPAGGFQFDGYAAALALDGDTALVGAYQLTVNAHPGAGKAFVYRPASGSWSLESELAAPVPDDNENFGRSVALDAGVAVVGLPPDQGGSACVYRRAGTAWTFEERLKNDPLGGEFGAALAIAGDLILVGAPAASYSASYSGSVHPFRRVGGTWLRDPAFVATDTVAHDGFGQSLALDAGRALIGSNHSEAGFLGLGAAYLFDTVPGLVLALDPDPPESGIDLDLRVRYGTPNGATWVAYSLRGTGSTYVAQLDVTLGLRQPAPLAGPAPANAQGFANWTVPVPVAAAGRAVWFQAVQFRKASNVVAAIVL